MRGFYTKRIIGSLMIFVFALIACSSDGKPKEIGFAHSPEEMKKLSELSELRYRYVITRDSNRLDSMLVIVNNMINEDGLSLQAVLNKLGLLGMLKRYEEGAEFLENIEHPLSIEIFPPYYKKVIELRFRAMAYNQEGNGEMKNKCLSEIVLLIGNYIEENKDHISVFLETSSEAQLLKGHYFLALTQYYGYLSLLEGTKAAETAMDEYFRPYKDVEVLTTFITDIMNESILLNGFYGF